MTNPNSPTSFEKKLREELYKLQVFRTVPREHTNWWYKQNRIVEAISKLHEEEVTIYYYYDEAGVKYFTPSLEFAHARAEKYNSGVYGEKYLVDVIEPKETK